MKPYLSLPRRREKLGLTLSLCPLGKITIVLNYARSTRTDKYSLIAKIKN